MNPFREDLLFGLALMKPAAERAAWLDRECGGDAALRQRLEALLAAHEASAGVLGDEPAAGFGVPSRTRDDLADHRPKPGLPTPRTQGWRSGAATSLSHTRADIEISKRITRPKSAVASDLPAQSKSLRCSGGERET